MVVGGGDYSVTLIAISIMCGIINGSTTESEVINIGGLFPLHCSKKVNRSMQCGAFRLDGYEEMLGMLFAVDKINEDRDLLPGILLKVNIEDSCSSVEIATEKSLKYTVAKYQSDHDCKTNSSEEPVIAIVGERSSDISRAITNLLGLFHIPVISYGSTSSSLNGVKYFLRTVPPDIHTAHAIIDVINKIGWNYIILIYGDNEYGRFAADGFRKRARKLDRKICIAVDEAINGEDPEDLKKTWKKMLNERKRTKVVVILADYEDFVSFLGAAGEENDVKQYIWVSDDLWNGRQANGNETTLVNMIKHAISIIPYQVHINEFETFFNNISNKLDQNRMFDSLDRTWFAEYESLVLNMPSSNKTCLNWQSSQVSCVIDAVYSIAKALHEYHCPNKNCTRHLNASDDILSWVKKVNFKNEWTGNNITFTEKGNPRYVKYSVVSLSETPLGNCFKLVGYWRCFVAKETTNSSCRGTLEVDGFPKRTAVDFLGVCGKICRPGEYKAVDKHFASCCWQCKKCNGNEYTDVADLSSCKKCDEGEWPDVNHTSCVQVIPKAMMIDSPSGIVLAVNCLALVLLFIVLVFFIKFRNSRMKIFCDPILCYLLLFNIAICYVSSMLFLTDEKKDFCLMLTFFTKIGSIGITATLLIKTNDVYRTYKKKVLKNGDRHSLTQSLKVVLIISLTLFGIILTWLGLNFSSAKLKTSTIFYFHSATENIAIRKCVYFSQFVFRKNIFTFLEFIYYGGLLFLCTYQAYLTRKVTDNNHGLRYVFFASLLFSINSVLTLIVFTFTGKQGKEDLILAIHHTFFATTALLCTFIPKMQVLFFYPEKDALFDAFRVPTLNPTSLSGLRLHRKKKETVTVEEKISTPSETSEK